jgi:predicted molibdopterin-dependent oxidoreductase YjgC
MRKDRKQTGGKDRRALIVDAVRRRTPRVRFTIDDAPAEAHAGQSVLAAMLLVGDRLRANEFSGAPRAGFCLMGACQDCWVWLADGSRLRACTTPIADGMAILTTPPAGFPRHG